MFPEENLAFSISVWLAQSQTCTRNCSNQENNKQNCQSFLEWVSFRKRCDDRSINAIDLVLHNSSGALLFGRNAANLPKEDMQHWFHARSHTHSVAICTKNNETSTTTLYISLSLTAELSKNQLKLLTSVKREEKCMWNSLAVCWHEPRECLRNENQNEFILLLFRVASKQTGQLN